MSDLSSPNSSSTPTWRGAIEATFGGQVFVRPTFYNNPGGLRFELSSGASPVELMLSALRKARHICEDIFEVEHGMTVCLAVGLPPSVFACRHMLRSLARAGIRIPHDRSMWIRTPEDTGSVWETLYIAFHAERDLLDNFLWCALAMELDIEPCPRCEAIYLMDLKRAVFVHPYDDRGMDVVGPNHALLAGLYARHGPHLLDYDRPAMAATFGI